MVASLVSVIQGVHHTPMSTLWKPYRLFDTCLTFLFTCRWFILPLVQVPSIYTLFNILPLFIVGGFYLAFFFILSHNFVGVHMFNKNPSHKHESFLYKQVRYQLSMFPLFISFDRLPLLLMLVEHGCALSMEV